MKKQLLALAAIAIAPIGIKAEERPNIIFLMTDDQGFNTISSLGNNSVQTPNLDRMVERGVAFTRHYATTSISMASRAIVMTGMYEYKTGCNFDHGALSTKKFQESYPVILREAGYFTGFGGKFGFAVSDEEGDSSYHSYDRLPMDDFDVWAGAPGQSSYITKSNKYIAEYAQEYPHSSVAYGAFGCDFIDRAQSENKPFCLSISFKAPHTPISPDPQFNDVYANTYFTLPESAAVGSEILPKQAKLGRQYLHLYKGGDDAAYQKHMQKYNQLIYGVDVAIGMILDKLEQTGLDKNTILIFTSDNGCSLGARRLGGKVLPYECSSRIPLIIVDPRQANSSGKRAEVLTGNIDIAPTIFEYAGVEIPSGVDGESLCRVVTNPSKAKEVHDDLMLINAWGAPGCLTLSVVDDNLKYIYWGFADGMDVAEELYDLSKDPDELINLVGQKRYAKDLERMRKLYDAKVEVWKRESTPRNNYESFATIYDRHTPWEVRKELIPDTFWAWYKTAVKVAMGSEGDAFDYDKVIESQE
ncbi:MAG: sulfatase-like hydrolase/transferase [Rikenellaceae bacterium]